MNERIKQVTDKIWTEEYWTNPNTDKLLPAQLNKFAELIVLDLIDSMIKRYGDDDELPIQEIKLFVKEHFGVEE